MQRLTILIAVVLVTFLSGQTSSAQGTGERKTMADISGVWEMSIIQFGEAVVNRITFRADGERITGTGAGNATVEGKLQGQKIEFELKRPNGTVMASALGTVKDDTMSGTVTLAGPQFTWTARRAATRPPNAPRLHEFMPEQFNSIFASTIPPVLHIFPGDTVKTKTVDAGGRDYMGTRRALGGNPLTGPFYIEGALPGDTLVVRFTRVRLNRDSAGSGSSIVPSLLLPGYFRSLTPANDLDGNWRLDRERGVAVLAKPSERLKNFTVPLQPMLGCVGVAPPRNQAIGSGNLGAHGGNLDYNQIREGTTIYLPVFHAGALLFVGDGHAAQGDGELTGDALETSMDVEFTVEVQQGKSIGNPRAENDEFLMALGIGASLNEAVQRATTELARWLSSDYKLNATEAALVLGTSIRYDIAELVDPQAHVVAKINKKVLAQLERGDK